MFHQAGDVLEYAATGERIVVVQLEDDARGEPCQLELTCAPHGAGPAAHVHPHSEETFEVRSGRLHVRVGRKVHVIGPGERAVVPPGTAHKVWNESNEEARALVQFSPALRMLTFFETMFGVLNDRKANPLQLAVVMREYRQECGPPLPVQNVVLAVLAPIGRLFGYRPRYAKYSD